MEETGVALSDLRFVAITNDRFGDEDGHYITIWIRDLPGDTEARIAAPEGAARGSFQPAMESGI